MIKLGDKSVYNCPKCDKEYNMEEYEKLDKAETQTYDEPIISVRGKAASKEALMEIAKRTGGKLYDGHETFLTGRRIKFMMQEYVLNVALNLAS